MAKYTTTVRSICEQAAGIESGGLAQVDTAIQRACPLIFTSAAPLFTPEYRETLLRKVLKHYYMREIGYETKGLWQLKLNTRLEEIAPYYSYLYQNGLGDLNPYDTVDLTTDYSGDDNRNIDTSHEGKADTDQHYSETGSSNSTRNEDLSQSVNSNTTEQGSTSDENRTENDTVVKESDTPQGGIDGLSSGKYLTNASITNASVVQTDSGSSNNSSITTAKTTGQNRYVDEGQTHSNRDQELSTTDNFRDLTSDVLQRQFLQKVSGRSGKSPIEIFKLIRENYYNLDMQFINEFSDLFMTIY